MARKTRRQLAAAIGGAASWDRNRPQKLADAAKGGLATLTRYGRAHYYRMTYLRWGRRANANSRVRDHAKCPLRVARQPEDAPAPVNANQTYRDHANPSHRVAGAGATPPEAGG